jgi:hypothetical protein
MKKLLTILSVVLFANEAGAEGNFFDQFDEDEKSGIIDPFEMHMKEHKKYACF